MSILKKLVIILRVVCVRCGFIILIFRFIVKVVGWVIVCCMFLVLSFEFSFWFIMRLWFRWVVCILMRSWCRILILCLRIMIFCGI